MLEKRAILLRTLNETSKANIYYKTGMSVDEIINTDFDLLDKKLIKPSLKLRNRLSKYSADSRLLGRGQVYSYLKRILSLKKIEKKLDRI